MAVMRTLLALYMVNHSIHPLASNKLFYTKYTIRIFTAELSHHRPSLTYAGMTGTNSARKDHRLMCKNLMAGLTLSPDQGWR